MGSHPVEALKFFFGFNLRLLKLLLIITTAMATHSVPLRIHL